MVRLGQVGVGWGSRKRVDRLISWYAWGVRAEIAALFGLFAKERRAVFWSGLKQGGVDVESGGRDLDYVGVGGYMTEYSAPSNEQLWESFKNETGVKRTITNPRRG